MDLSFLMVFLKTYFFDPAKRQNFGNALAEICIPVLRVRHKCNLVTALQGPCHCIAWAISSNVIKRHGPHGIKPEAEEILTSHSSLVYCTRF